MGVVTCTRKISPYETWYEFKKDLERNLGYMLLNQCWLEVKPKAPLPWDSLHMQAAVSVVTTLGKSKTVQRQERNRRRQLLTQHERKHVYYEDWRRRNSCEEWSDCDICPIAIDECAWWWNGNQSPG